MAGITKVYCVGGSGGYLGADGINPVALVILLGDGNRQWFELGRRAEDVEPLGNVSVLIPEDPAGADRILDACLAFGPSLFPGCPTMGKVKSLVGQSRSVDRHSGPKPLREAWRKLREEARSIFEGIGVCCGELEPMVKASTASAK